LIILVNSYLTAWYRQSDVRQKDFLLNEHISTIQKYLGNRTSDFDVLVGIQAFFYNNPIKGQKSESKFIFFFKKITKKKLICNIYRFLLQFFIDHQCITPNIILDWYNNNDAHNYMGFAEARQLVEPFIQFLSIIDTNKDVTNGMVILLFMNI
jgi:hypothetical protein